MVALSELPRASGKVAPLKIRISYDPEVARRVGRLSADAIKDLESVPWDGRAVVAYLRHRYADSRMSFRKLSSADVNFDILWTDIFGHRRGFDFTCPRDGHDCYPGKRHTGPPDRVLEEWRIFRMMLNYHLIKSSPASNTSL